MKDHQSLLILVDFDGDRHSGIFRVYPANDDSDPSCDFKSEFTYGTSCADFGFETINQARQAAHAEAQRLAKRIGGDWATNE